jgi:hypothetical protein
MANLLRPPAARARIGVKKTKFDKDYVDHGKPGEECIPGTNVKRLRPAPLGPRAIGFFDDEIDDLIEALRKRRDAMPPPSARRTPTQIESEPAPIAPQAGDAPTPRVRSLEPLVRRPLSAGRR